jgi:hypothetical protein
VTRRSIAVPIYPAVERNTAQPVRASKPRGIKSATETSKAMAITGKSRQNFWLKWAEIAIAHEHEAWSARRRAEGAEEVDGLAFDAEFTASLVSVTSAAFALEALANHAEDWLGVSIPEEVQSEWKGKKMPAAVRIFALLSTAFDFGEREEEWRKKVRALFDLRNDAVHFKAEWHELAPHPTGKSDVSREVTIYTAEEASKSVALAAEIIIAGITSPREDQPQVQAWAESAPHVIDRLEELRGRSS